jgi:hypothetical protein
MYFQILLIIFNEKYFSREKGKAMTVYTAVDIKLLYSQNIKNIFTFYFLQKIAKQKLASFKLLK